jgi:type II secretory pathway pseudopilin PulG
MRQRSAFTLIEVAVAITITIILAGVAVPRYNSLIRNQDFYAQVQELASCLQRAQSLASGSQGATLSTVTPIRWSAAEFSFASDTVTCRVMAFDGSSANTFALLAASSPVSTLNSGSNTFTATDVAGIASTRRIYFGTLERGLPVKDTGSADPTYLGSGLTLSIPLSSSLDSGITATLSMGRSGAPIEVVK